MTDAPLPVCTQDPIVDAGLGVRFEVRRMDGRIAGVAIWHPRPDGQGECNIYGWVSFKPDWDDGWDLVSESPLTISPSILCRGCGHHGYVRDGRWEPA